MSNLPMPEGSARAKTYNPVLDKLEVLNAELRRLADSLNLNVIRFWEKALGVMLNAFSAYLPLHS